MKREVVYILTNESMPDLIKIGKVDKKIEERMKELSRHSGVPLPFECYYACEVDKTKDVETRLHFSFDAHRVNPNREFFRIAPERVKMMLEGFKLKNVTPKKDVVEDQKEQIALNKERSRRPIFKFSMIDIKKGSVLSFLKDETRTAKVINNNDIIEFEGRRDSLGRITLDLLPEFGINWSSARGSNWWLFENETLTDRRLRLEQGGEQEKTRGSIPIVQTTENRERHKVPKDKTKRQKQNRKGD